MPNTSASGGYLAPTSGTLVEDIDLDELLQALVVGITSIPGSQVRPRWQPTPPPELPAAVDWAAIGVIDEIPESNATVRHFPGTPANYFDPAGVGFDEAQRHVTLEIMVSFYGPHSRGLANLFRDGLYIAQNREQLLLEGMAFINVDRAVAAPELVNGQWRQRTDLTFRVRRAITRTYAVENLLEGVGEIVTDQGNTETGEVRGTEPWDTSNRRE